MIRTAEVKRKEKFFSVMHRIEEPKSKGTQRRQELKEKNDKEHQQMGILGKPKT